MDVVHIVAVVAILVISIGIKIAIMKLMFDARRDL
jgi:hypothetical protein